MSARSIRRVPSSFQIRSSQCQSYHMGDLAHVLSASPNVSNVFEVLVVRYEHMPPACPSRDRGNPDHRMIGISHLCSAKLCASSITVLPRREHKTFHYACRRLETAMHQRRLLLRSSYSFARRALFAVLPTQRGPTHPTTPFIHDHPNLDCSVWLICSRPSFPLGDAQELAAVI